ncbi:hypothetical protein VTO73DRAFT_7554 [Trametes versicolor]
MARQHSSGPLPPRCTSLSMPPVSGTLSTQYKPDSPLVSTHTALLMQCVAVWKRADVSGGVCMTRTNTSLDVHKVLYADSPIARLHRKAKAGGGRREMEDKDEGMGTETSDAAAHTSALPRGIRTGRAHANNPSHQARTRRASGGRSPAARLSRIEPARPPTSTTSNEALAAFHELDACRALTASAHLQRTRLVPSGCEAAHTGPERRHPHGIADVVEQRADGPATRSEFGRGASCTYALAGDPSAQRKSRVLDVVPRTPPRSGHRGRTVLRFRRVARIEPWRTVAERRPPSRGRPWKPGGRYGRPGRRALRIRLAPH